MKKLLLILISVIFHGLTIFGKLAHQHWEAITKDIATIGDEDNKGEFEAAKQAFLNIALPANRERAAQEIADKWAKNFPAEASKDKLIALKPYPRMDDDDVMKATVDLFDKTNIKDFLDKEDIKVDTSAAKDALKKKGKL